MPKDENLPPLWPLCPAPIIFGRSKGGYIVKVEYGEQQSAGGSQNLIEVGRISFGEVFS